MLKEFLTKKFDLNLDKNGTAFLKAFAIFFVVSHNYWHNIVPTTGENEMFFSLSHILNFWAAIRENPFNFFNCFFSFFGYYGVHIFIFLSGYGLTKKCMASMGLSIFKISCSASFHAIFKLIQLSLVGFLAILIARNLQGIPISKDFFYSYLSVLTFSNNLRPGHLYDFCTVCVVFSTCSPIVYCFPFCKLIPIKIPQAISNHSSLLTSYLRVA